MFGFSRKHKHDWTITGATTATMKAYFKCRDCGKPGPSWEFDSVAARDAAMDEHQRSTGHGDIFIRQDGGE